MIIGVDAGPLAVSDDRLRVGVHRTSFELLAALAAIDKKNRYLLYSFASIPASTMRRLGRTMENVVLSPAVGYMAFRLPLELTRRPPDVFLGLSQALPRWYRGRSVAIAYDCGFLHEPAAYGASAKALMRQTAYMATRADAIVAISRSTAQDMTVRYQVPERKLTVAYPGVERAFRLAGPSHAESAPYFLTVGSVRAGKNLAVVIAAFAQFRHKVGLPYRLLIAGGDYWPDGDVARAIASSGVADDIAMLGFVSDADLPAYYRGATALLAPSLWEGFCLPAAEAMASGVPVIASNRGALPEIIGSAGLFADAHDSGAFADAMEVVFRSPAKRRTMANAGVVRAKRYAWPSFAKAVLGALSGIGEQWA